MSMEINNNGAYGWNAGVPLTGTAYANIQKADEIVAEQTSGTIGKVSAAGHSENSVTGSYGKDGNTAVVYEPSKTAQALASITVSGTEQESEKSAGLAAAEKTSAAGSADSSAKKTNVNKMSAEDRAKVASQLKAAADARQRSLMDMVNKSLAGQASAVAKSKGLYSVFSNMKVDAATAAQAQKDISEDGYWGVKQTSQRLFDFASALAGDDVDKMREMQKAMQKGFKQATKAWGRELPSISQQTMDRANQLFEDYYDSKSKQLEE